MTKLSGSAVALTGAASGIGRALAKALYEKGSDLALADRDEVGLAAVAAQLTGRGKVTTHRIDVASFEDVERFAAAAIAAHPTLNIIINNAGVALMGDHDEVTLADMRWLMEINFWGVVNGCRAFMPQLVSRPNAHIVNISSVFGLFGPPGNTAYAAAKFAVRGYSESLRHELDERGGNIHVSTVHPGGIKTNIVKNARAVQSLSNRRAQLEEGFDKLARSTPEQAAARIIAGIEHDEPRILIGGDARMIDILQRISPVNCYRWLRRLTQRTIGAGRRPSAKIID